MPIFKRTRVAAPVVLEQVPGYRDLHRIGQGGFSVVYRAHQEEIGRDVALKILAVEFIDGRILRQFLREVQLTAKLTGHPNVVTVLDSGLTGSGRPYIAMDFYDRGSLRDRLRAEGPLPVREVLRVGVKIAAALEAAHREGFLHRDVKPQNILMSRFGEPALGDFGTARLTAALDATSHTEALTPIHAAPEILQGHVPDARADLYSLGSTLFQLLEGRPAFEREAEPGIAPLLLRVLTEPVPRMTNPDVPDALPSFTSPSRARELGDRYAAGGEFAAALQGVQTELGFAVTEAAGETSGAAQGLAVGVGHAAPTATVSAPTVEASAPAATVSAPTVEAPASAATVSAPTVQVPAPTMEAPAPTVEVPALTVEASAPPLAVTAAASGAPPYQAPATIEADPPLAATPWSSSETVTDWKSALPPEAANGAKPSPAAALAGLPSARAPLPRTLRLPWYESKPQVLRAVTIAGGAVVAVGGVVVALVLSGGSKPVTRNVADTGASATTAASSSSVPAAAQQPGSIPAPSAVAAKTEAATVTLTWTLPQNGAQNPLMIVANPNPGSMPMVSAGTGVSSYVFNGLNPAVHYCFKVGIYAGYARDGSAIFSWADPVCSNG